VKPWAGLLTFRGTASWISLAEDGSGIGSPVEECRLVSSSAVYRSDLMAVKVDRGLTCRRTVVFWDLRRRVHVMGPGVVDVIVEGGRRRREECYGVGCVGC
jgi:hypothetical protein